MAEGNIVPYNAYRANIDGGSFSWTGTTFKVTLHTGYTPNIDSDTWAGISATEYSTSGGYTAGGATITGATRTQDNTANLGRFDCDNISWATLLLSPATPSHAVVREDVSDQLVFYIELGTTATVGAPFYNLVVNASGLFTV